MDGQRLARTLLRPRKWHRSSQRDVLLGPDDDGRARRDSNIVGESSIRGAQVLKRELAFVLNETTVVTGDGGVIHDDVATAFIANQPRGEKLRGPRDAMATPQSGLSYKTWEPATSLETTEVVCSCIGINNLAREAQENMPKA